MSEINFRTTGRVKLLILILFFTLFPNPVLASDMTAVILTREEKHFITTHNPLSFSEVNWKPLSIVDNPDGFDGMIADYFNIITRHSGLRFEFRESTTWAEVLLQYENQAIEVIPALGKDDDIGRGILISDPFVKFPLVIVTRNDVSYIKDTAELNNRKVAVGRGYTSYPFLSSNYPAIDLVQTDDVKKGLILLANHDVSAFVGHLAVVINTIQDMGLTRLKITGETGIDYSFFGKIMAGAALFVLIVIYWNRKLAGEVAERKRTELRLTENERKTRAMSEAIHDGLVMIDERTKIMYWNHAAEALFGIPVEKALGQDMNVLFALDESLERTKEDLKNVTKTGQGSGIGRLQELTALHMDGARFPVEVGFSVFQVNESWYAVGTIRDISERIQVQESMQKIQTELQQIFDNTQVGILFFKNRHHLYRCNTRAADIMGYCSPSEMTGMNMIDLHLTREKFDQFDKNYDSILGKGKQVRTEYKLMKKDGTGIWCSLSGKALDVETIPKLDKGVIWVIDDITDKRRARHALKESEERVKTILDAINTGFILINPDNRIIEDVNPAAARMIGLSRDAITGHVCHEFICPKKEFQCPIIDHRRQIDNSEQVLLTADRREIPILKTVIPVMLNGKQQLLESFVDLTDTKEAEKELQRNYQELERFYRLTVDREEKMIDLKNEINHLLLQTGEKVKYKIR